MLKSTLNSPPRGPVYPPFGGLFSNRPRGGKKRETVSKGGVNRLGYPPKRGGNLFYPPRKQGKQTPARGGKQAPYPPFRGGKQAPGGLFCPAGGNLIFTPPLVAVYSPSGCCLLPPWLLFTPPRRFFTPPWVAVYSPFLVILLFLMFFALPSGSGSVRVRSRP